MRSFGFFPPSNIKYCMSPPPVSPSRDHAPVFHHVEFTCTVTSLILCTGCRQLCWGPFLFLRVLKNHIFLHRSIFSVFQFRSTCVMASAFVVDHCLVGWFSVCLHCPCHSMRSPLSVVSPITTVVWVAVGGRFSAGPRGLNTVLLWKLLVMLLSPASTPPSPHPALCSYNSPHDSK